jgi:YVTN family beta-propeller protein
LQRNIALVLIFLANLLLAASYAPATAIAQELKGPPPPGFCFPETNKCIYGVFYYWWNDNGGLRRHGFPVTDEIIEKGSDGKEYRVQYFERSRFEYHPELVNTPYLVQYGLLGIDEFKARYPNGAPKSGGEICFSETGNCIRGEIAKFWQQNGGLASFGFPLSDEIMEKSETDGNTYPSQYFERARLEYHAELFGTDYAVLIGQLGREMVKKRYPNGTPAAIDPRTPAINIYKDALTTEIRFDLAGLPPRVYAPNENGGNVTVIDPRTFEIVDNYYTGSIPHHATPAHDMKKLYVNNMGSNTLTEIDAVTGKPARNISIPVPYNMYYTLDGTKAIVAAEPANQLIFYNPQTWEELKRIYIPWPGVDHMDMSPDGKYLFASTEFSGVVVKVDTVKMEMVGWINVGGLPVDVRFSPDGTVVYVANQGRHGVSIIDWVAMKEIGFLPTGTGAHGMHVSRDAKTLYVSNRLAGSISTIDFETRQITATWNIGGSPDMLQISPDGKQLWASGRFNGSVYVVDTTTGQLIKTIFTGSAPHGIAYFPQPGKFSIGHNGVYR